MEWIEDKTWGKMWEERMIPMIPSMVFNNKNSDEGLLYFCIKQILETNVLQIISQLSEEDKKDYYYQIDTYSYVYKIQANSIFLDKLTCFDNFAIKVETITQTGYYEGSKPKYYFLIDNKEIPQNIPIVYRNRCNCYLTKQIITNVIMNYNREYGVFLKNFMESENNIDFYKYHTLYEINGLARLFESVGRYLI